MFCQLLAVSTGRSHVVAWPGRPLGGQSSALAVTESPEVWSRLWGLQVRWGSCGQAQLGRRCCGIQERGGVLRVHPPVTPQQLARATPAVATRSQSPRTHRPALTLPWHRAWHSPPPMAQRSGNAPSPQDEDETRRLGGTC